MSIEIVWFLSLVYFLVGWHASPVTLPPSPLVIHFDPQVLNDVIFVCTGTLYYKHITIINYGCKSHHNLECHSRSLIDDSRSIINNSRSIINNSWSIIDNSISKIDDSRSIIDGSAKAKAMAITCLEYRRHLQSSYMILNMCIVQATVVTNLSLC
jgi:hypothetical protein